MARGHLGDVDKCGSRELTTLHLSHVFGMTTCGWYGHRRHCSEGLGMCEVRVLPPHICIKSFGAEAGERSIDMVRGRFRDVDKCESWEHTTLHLHHVSGMTTCGWYSYYCIGLEGLDTCESRFLPPYTRANTSELMRRTGTVTAYNYSEGSVGCERRVLPPHTYA